MMRHFPLELTSSSSAVMITNLKRITASSSTLFYKNKLHYYYCLFKTIASVSNYFHNKRTFCSSKDVIQVDGYLWNLIMHSRGGYAWSWSAYRLCHRSAYPNKTSFSGTRLLPWQCQFVVSIKGKPPPLISIPPPQILKEHSPIQFIQWLTFLHKPTFPWKSSRPSAGLFYLLDPPVIIICTIDPSLRHQKQW